MKEKPIYAYVNGIIDILFIISILISIKIPAAIYVSLVIAGVALVVNIILLKSKKDGSD